MTFTYSLPLTLLFSALCWTMGVTGLWTIVHPCARPIKIETLNRKRLAVDASIWIYQFLKAVRDKEGNQLRNSHVVGFFRRICKLLFIGIKPVFVFDGGAPVLKRQTINARKSRREGRREDAARTAGKLLAIQMQRAAAQEIANAKLASVEQHSTAVAEPAVPDEVIYADEVQMTDRERTTNRGFRKTDAYHLPNLNVSIEEMSQPNDPRVMSLDELQEYASHFQSGEDINFYDFSNIDFDGAFFQSLPAADQYNILNAARLRSRLRMGYSKEQLDVMFPDRMAFSRFQIERVRERNDLTQRLMRLQGMTADGDLIIDGMGRVAGDKGREYLLVRNDGAEGGWVLGVMTREEGSKKENAIDVDAPQKRALADIGDTDESEDDDEEFEDVPIEGLNRLPRREARPGLMNELLSSNIRRRRDFYRSRRSQAIKSGLNRQHAERFAAEGNEYEEQEEEEDGLFVENHTGETEDQANNAEDDDDLHVAIALSLQQQDEPLEPGQSVEVEAPDSLPQRKVHSQAPFEVNRRGPISSLINAKSSKIATAKEVSSDDDEDFQDLQKALLQSRKNKVPIPSAIAAGLDGPLPFKKLDLGFSLFDKKPKKVEMEGINSEFGGGFIPGDEAKEKVKEKAPTSVIPAWFKTGKDLDTSERKQAVPLRLVNPVHQTEDSMQFVFGKPAEVSKQNQTIDLSKEDDEQDINQTIDLSKDEESENEQLEYQDIPIFQATKEERKDDNNVPNAEETVRKESELTAVNNDKDDDEDEDWEDVANKQEYTVAANDGDLPDEVLALAADSAEVDELLDGLAHDDQIDVETIPTRNEVITAPEHEDVLESKDPDANDKQENEEEDYLDEEEDDLFRQIIQEEKEHERFTSSLNQRTYEEQLADMDFELKRLRTQQKKDRRDADEVSQTMIIECQELLSLFGLPYITAPMEAEAQCAALVDLGLVDGEVTDDSDIFLFGGTRVYKNMFNQAKTVECYLSGDLESEYGLDRHRLIAIAQLLGSDYAEGLPGVGPVTALEILSEFGSLSQFRSWFTAVQSGTRSKAEDARSAKGKLWKYATKISLPSNFPDLRVEEAYLQPEVDKDPSQFAWGVPDLAGLRAYLSHTIGWSLERTDEVLVPVIRHMNSRGTEGLQSNITAFFAGGTGAGALAPRQRSGDGSGAVAVGSKRLRMALEKIGDRAPKAAPRSLAQSVAEEDDIKDDDNNDGNDGGIDTVRRKKRAKRKKK